MGTTRGIRNIWNCYCRNFSLTFCNYNSTAYQCIAKCILSRVFTPQLLKLAASPTQNSADKKPILRKYFFLFLWFKTGVYLWDFYSGWLLAAICFVFVTRHNRSLAIWNDLQFHRPSFLTDVIGIFPPKRYRQTNPSLLRSLEAQSSRV